MSSEIHLMTCSLTIKIQIDTKIRRTSPRTCRGLHFMFLTVCRSQGRTIKYDKFVAHKNIHFQHIHSYSIIYALFARCTNMTKYDQIRIQHITNVYFDVILKQQRFVFFGFDFFLSQIFLCAARKENTFTWERSKSETNWSSQ